MISSFVLSLWWKTCAFFRRLWLVLAHVNDPWEDWKIDLKHPALRRMIAHAIWNERRERGSMICWSHSRDRIVEQRELRLLPARRSSREKQTDDRLRRVA
jgi:hypothetical protein